MKSVYIVYGGFRGITIWGIYPTKKLAEIRIEDLVKKSNSSSIYYKIGEIDFNKSICVSLEE